MLANNILSKFPANLAAALAFTIAHEAGHTFGEPHTENRPIASDNDRMLVQSDIMSEFNNLSFSPGAEQHQNLNMFTRYPLVEGVGRNGAVGSSGVVNPYAVLRQSLGMSGIEYVTGTGANDIIDIAKTSDTQATVTVTAYADANYATPIPVPGAGTPSFTYTIDLTKPLVVDAGFGDDTIQLDADLGTNITIRGMSGTDHLFIRGKGADSGTYIPNATTQTGLDGTISYGGTLTFSTTRICFSEFEPTGSVQVDDFTKFTFQSPGGADFLIVDSPQDGINRISGTVTGPAGTTIIVPLSFSAISTFNVDTAHNDNQPANDSINIESPGLVAPGLTQFNVTTGDGDDELTVPSADSVRSLVFDGGGGNNTLALQQTPEDPNVPSWKIAGNNTGNVDDTVQFVHVQNLNGSKVDTGNEFAFLPGGSVDGNVIGGPGNDTLDFSALNLPLSAVVVVGPGTVDGQTGTIGPWTDSRGIAGAIPIGGSFDNINQIIAAPTVTAQPSDQTVNESDTATFTAAASDGYPTPTTVQWQVSSDGGSTFSNLSNTGRGGVSGTVRYSGVTTPTLIITNISGALDGYQYRAVFSNSAGCSATSHAANLTLQAAPTVTASPHNQRVFTGGTTSFTAAFSPGDPAATTTQWRVSTDGGNTFFNLSNGGFYSGVTTTMLTITGASDELNNNQYRAVFSNTIGSNTTRAATLGVGAPASVGGDAIGLPPQPRNW